MKRRDLLRMGLGLAALSSKSFAWTPGGDLSAEEKKTLLLMHNRARNDVGVPALTWSDELADSAQIWAEYMARTGNFKHSEVQYGENLSSCDDLVEVAVGYWIDEKKFYRPGSPSTLECGHYTQVVWRNTKRLGAGKAQGDGTTFWVCQYDPPGNFRGKAPY